MNFELPKEMPSIIKVIGVGGGGSNAVNHMFRQGIKGVEFLVCNTDLQALETSPVPHKIQLGAGLTEGRGAGSMPEVGKNSAMENLEDLRQVLSERTKMIFITAGMGGGTGTGAAPIIAALAREMGILTVAIVTIPFSFEGKKRKQQAEAGIEELKECVDTLLIICNDKLREIHGNLRLADAFSHADNVLATAARSIAEIISVTLHINVDFADVETVMKKSGQAIMGSAISSGENRAVRAVELALDSPLLNDNNIEGARYILLNITSGDSEITMDEMGDITDFIQQQAGQTAEVIMGVGTDENLGDKICVTIIATGFKTREQIRAEVPVERIVHDLHAPEKNETITELFGSGQAQEPTLRTVDEDGQEDGDGLTFIDEEKIYEPEISDRVVYQLEDDEAEAFQDPEGDLPELHARREFEPETKVAEHEADETAKADDDEADDRRENVFTFEIGGSEPAETPAEPEEAPRPRPAADVPATPPTSETETGAAPPADEPVAEPAGEEKGGGGAPAAREEPAEDPHEELFRRSRERIMKLKEMSYRISTPQGLNDLEKEPAFRRKNIKLDDMPSSSKTDVSRFSLFEDQDKKVGIKPNSFLHDKAD